MLQPINDQDNGYGELIEPPPSLWKLVEQQVPEIERTEIKRILGEAAVDLSLELHAEVEVLLDLWREVRSTYPVSRQSSLHNTCSILADPPVIKDMVAQEIQMLLLSVRQKAWSDGLNADQAVLKYNQKVVNFVMGLGRPESRASTSSSGVRSRKHGVSRAQTDSRGDDERPFSSLSIGSSIEDDLEDLKEKLKVSDIDEVVVHLQSLLEEECKTLEKDIGFLQQCLEEEHLSAIELHTPLPEPSLSELREERRIIERDLQLNQPAVFSKDSQYNIVTKTTKPSRPRSSFENPNSRMSYTRPASSSLPQYGACITPCPITSKHKLQDVKKTNAVSLAFLTPASLTLPSPPQITGAENCAAVGQRHTTDGQTDIASHRGIKSSTLPTYPSSDLQNSTPPFLNIKSGTVPSSNCVLVEQIQNVTKHVLMPQELGSVFVPSPPLVQRPANSAYSFHRVRAQKSQPSS